MTEIISLSDTEQLKNILCSNPKVIVKFEADWCGPCRTIAPFYEQIAKENVSKLLLCKVNSDSAMELVHDQKVTSLPTFKFFHDGKVVDTIVGASKDKLVKAVQDLIEK